jgi:hypothetical protein
MSSVRISALHFPGGGGGMKRKRKERKEMVNCKLFAYEPGLKSLCF